MADTHPFVSCHFHFTRAKGRRHGIWSVQRLEGNATVDHYMDSLILDHCTFHASTAGAERIRAKGSKEVVAKVRGIYAVCDYPEPNHGATSAKLGPFPALDAAWFEGHVRGLEVVHYNPYRSDHFHRIDADGVMHTVTYADRVWFPYNFRGICYIQGRHQ
jgi:hypothetical protein